MPKTKQFDREQVLSQALQLFWRQGYTATSIQDIRRETGLKPGSIYDTFGDKHGLFMAVVAYYRRIVIDETLKVLHTPGPVRDAIQNYLNLLQVKFCQADHRFGCLMANSTAELAGLDQTVAQLVGQHLQTLEANFRQALERGVHQGEISPETDLTALARFLTTQVVGMSVISKAETGQAYLNDSIQVIMSTIR